MTSDARQGGYFGMPLATDTATGTGYGPSDSWATPVASGERIEVLPELRSFAITTFLVALLGAPIGLIWAALRPTIDPYVVSMAAESALTPQFDADMILAGLGLAGGVLAGLLAWLVSRRGTRRAASATGGLGVAVGLGVGGVLAMLIAARTGMIAAHPEHLYRDTNAALKTHGSALISAMDSSAFLDLLRFRLRAHTVLLVMTVSGPLVFGALTALLDRSAQAARRVSWGSVGSGSAPELAQLSTWSGASAPAAAGSTPPAADQRW